MIKDVNVIISRETASLTQTGFGMPLILATHGAVDYKEYTELAQVAEDYAEATEAYKMANRIFAQSPHPEKIAMRGVSYGGSETSELIAALNQLVEVKNDWYFLLSDQQGEEEITALSQWVDGQKKLYFAATDSLSLPQTLESERTVLIYHHEPKSYPDAGWVGKCAPEIPGAITWKFKNMTGVGAANIGITDLQQLHTDGGNSYVRKLGLLQTSEGLTTSGEYIDIIRSQDFIEARMVEEVSMALFSNKIPYDNSGIAVLVDKVENVLKLATAQGIVALDADGRGMWRVNAVSREETPVNDVANRIYNGISWGATVAGAIHNTTIRGTLTY